MKTQLLSLITVWKYLPYNMKTLCVGDLVLSLKGRDKGKEFLVVKVSDKYALIVDGKTRKIQNPKRKSVKHLVKLQVEGLESLATKIQNEEPLANKRVCKAIKQKIKED